MKTFKEFLIESIAKNATLIHDGRENSHEPFYVAYKPSWKNNPSLVQFYHKDKFKRVIEHNGEKVHFSTTGILVDPMSKTISLDQKEENHNNRRPNIVLGSGKYKSSRSTPILKISDMPDDHKFIHLLKKHVSNISEYSIDGQSLPDRKTAAQKYSEGREPITLYHGTSSKRVPDILKNGLSAGKRDYSYVDLIPNYSEHNVYLTTDPNDASNYATRQAIHDKSSPTVLKVQIHPHQFHNLRPDEDSMHWTPQKDHQGSVHPAAWEEFKRKQPNAVSEFHFKHMNHETGSALNLFKNDYFPTEEENKSMFNDAMKLFTAGNPIRRGTAAYKGTIHPSQIKPHSTWKTKSTKMDPTDEEYNEAYLHMLDSFKKFD